MGLRKLAEKKEGRSIRPTLSYELAIRFDQYKLYYQATEHYAPDDKEMALLLIEERLVNDKKFLAWRKTNLMTDTELAQVSNGASKPGKIQKEEGGQV